MTDLETSPMTLPLRPLAVAGFAALALAACATKKPPPPMGSAGPIIEPNAPPPPGVKEEDADRALASAAQQAEFASRSGGDRVYFDYDRAEVKPEAARVLDGQAQWLQAHPRLNLRIEGNADERGTREYNLALSQRRADAVRDYLAQRGVTASRLNTIGYGKERPVDSSGTEDGMAKNRNAHSALTV